MKEGDDGKFFSLAFTRKEQQPKSEARPQASAKLKAQQSSGNGQRAAYSPRQRLDDEIPF